jgi:hypothetical protein
MMGVAVVRTDKQKQSELESGKFTAEDRAVLRSIQQAVIELVRK